jgi:hypothetical protein
MSGRPDHESNPLHTWDAEDDDSEYPERWDDDEEDSGGEEPED